MAIGFVTLLAVWMLSKCTGNDTVTPPTLIYIPQGDHARITQALGDQGVDISDKDMAEYLGSKSIKAGWIRFDKETSLGYKDFMNKLSNQKREKTRRVVMFGGDTIHLFTKKLASQTNLSKDDLINAYYERSPYSDGGILAGYYSLPYRITPGAAMYYLTKSTANQFKKIAKRYGKKYDPESFKKYLITASVIQKETWHEDEMPLIASVIKNRLKKGVRLQLDWTLNYGPYAHTPVTPQRIRTDESRFNTYKHKGLPPEPIGSVSKKALDAALKPASTKYMFFVRNAKGKHVFSETYNNHLMNIESTKSEKAMILAVDQNISAGSSAIGISQPTADKNSSSAPLSTKHQ